MGHLFPCRPTEFSCPEFVVLVSLGVVFNDLEVPSGGAPQFSAPEFHVLLDECTLLGRLLCPRAEVASLQKVGMGRGGQCGEAKNSC